MKNTTGKSLTVCSVLLFLSLAGLLLQHINIYNHNKKERILNTLDVDSDTYVKFKVDVTGSWEKLMPGYLFKPEYFDKSSYAINDNNEIKTYGKTYDFTITNLSNADITSWYAVIKIPEDTYLNKSWNGNVCFNQNSGTKSQTFNPLKDLPENILLDYDTIDGLYLFPLEKNAQIFYHPSVEYYETPISPSAPKNNSFLSKTFGIIFYSEAALLNFKDVEIHYTIHLKLSSFRSFWINCGFIAFFFIGELILMVNLVLTRRYERRRLHDKKIIIQAIGTFSQFIDAKDSYTRHHSLRVAYYSKMIAKKLKFNEDFVENIFYIGLLHDAGKVNIQDEILNKPGKLTDEEFDIIKTHTTTGAELLKGFTAIDNLVNGALCHHERYDGTGYPLGLKGEQIPTVSRIIAVADAYDAMSSNRCYRAQLTKEKILDELNSNKGKQFDSNVVEAFVDCLENGEVERIDELISKDIIKLS